MSTGFRCRQPGRYQFEKDLCPRCAAARPSWPIVAEIARAFRCGDCNRWVRAEPPPAEPRITYRPDASPRDVVEFEALLEKLAQTCPAGRRVRIPSSDRRGEAYRRGLLARAWRRAFPRWSLRRLAEALVVTHPTAAKAAAAAAPAPAEPVATALGEPAFEIPAYVAAMLPKLAPRVLPLARTGNGWELRIRAPEPGPYPVSPTEAAILGLLGDGLERLPDKLPPV